MTALGKTAEILRGLGGALGCSCPSDPRRVTPPPAGEANLYEITLLLVSLMNFDMPVVQFYICNMSKHARDVLPGREGRVCRGLSRGSLPVRNTGEMGAGAGSCA